VIAISDRFAPGGMRPPGPTPRRRAGAAPTRLGHVSGWMDRIVGPYDRLGVRRVLLLCDLFCGAGGFTTGAMRALRELGLEAVMAAVNHWPVAIATHHLNHPHVRHYIEDVKAANPVDVVPERYLDVLLCSPSCVFFSRARGGRPNSDQKRMDPEAIIRWIDELDVRVLICENVPEFKDWCRIDPRTNRPMKGRKGEYFWRWIRRIERRGYRVEWRILTCADYGDATSRQRWFMIARKDGQPIEWPRPTHSRHGGVDAEGRPLRKWRGAAEIIDWSDRGTSIFNRRPRRKGYKGPKGSLRALAYNTLRRVKAGTDRFTGPWRHAFAAAIEEEMEMVRLDEAGLDRPERRALLTFRWTEEGALPVDPDEATVTFASGELLHHPDGDAIVVGPAPQPDPYLVMLYGTNTVRGVGTPAPTATAGGGHAALARAGIDGGALVPYTCANRTDNAPRGIGQPLAPILTGTGGGLWLAEPGVQPYLLSQQSGGAPREASRPIPAVATAGAISLAMPALVAMKGHSTVAAAARPLPAVTAHSTYLALSEYLVVVNHGDGPGGSYARRIRDVGEPLQGLTTTRGIALSLPTVAGADPRLSMGYTAAFFGSNVGRRNAAAGLSYPLGAVTTRARYGFCLPSITPYLVPQFGERPGQAPRVHRIDLPAPAVTSHGAGALVVPVLVRFDHAGAGGTCVRSTEDPLWTATGKTGCGLAESYIICPRHSRQGGGPAPRDARLPVPTLTGGGSQFGVVNARAGREQLFLPGTGRDEPLAPELPLAGSGPTPAAPTGGRIIWVDGVIVWIDVAFRMLRNRELARSHSFDDEESTYEFIGTEAEQTKQVGNSVPVATARALVLSQIRAIPGVVPIASAGRRRKSADAPPAPRHEYLAAA
jgi:DNA (cytosine-5)-methyltransferase 1